MYRGRGMADTQNTAATYKEYKSTSLDYVAVTPRHWSLKKLKFISSIANGATPLSSIASYWNGDILWATPTDISQVNYIQETERHITYRGYLSCGTTIVSAGSIVLTTRAPIGNIAIAASELCTNQGCKALTINDGLSKKYFYFYLASIVEKLKSLGTGTTFMELSTNELRSFVALVPPLTEQLAIANYLKSKTTLVDKAISTKERQIVLLKERKQILIQQAVTRGLNPDAPMRDSGIEWIGEIPAHWKTVRLKYLFKEINARTKTGEETLLSLRMELGLVPHDDVSDKAISNESLVDYKLVRPGQMVMNRMRAAIGIFGVSSRFGLVSPDYAVFDIKECANSSFFLRLFKLPLLGTQFRLGSKGLGTGSSGFMRLYTENFGDIKVAVPPLGEQLEILQFIDSTSERLNNACTVFEQQVTKLKEYKATLINSAVTGKIKVPGVVEPHVQDMEVA